MASSWRQSVSNHFPVLPTSSPGLEGSTPASHRSQRDNNISNAYDSIYLSTDAAVLASTMTTTGGSPRSVGVGRGNVTHQVEDYNRILDSIGQPNYAAIKSLFDPNERHGAPAEIVPSVQVSFELFEAVQNRLAATRKTLERTKGDLITRNQQYTVLLSEMQALKDLFATLQKRTTATESGNLSLHQQVAKQDVALEQLNKEIGQVHLDMDMLIQKLKRRDEELQNIRNRMAEGLVLISQKDNVILALRRELEKYTQPIPNLNDEEGSLDFLNGNNSYSAERLQSITDIVHGRTERARMKLSVADLEAKLRRVEDEKNSIMTQHDRYLDHVQATIAAHEHQLLAIEDGISSHVCAPGPYLLSSRYYTEGEDGLPNPEREPTIEGFQALLQQFPEVLERLAGVSVSSASAATREGLEGCLGAQRGVVLVAQELTRFLSTLEQGVKGGSFLSIYEAREEWAKLQVPHFAARAARELQQGILALVEACRWLLEHQARPVSPQGDTAKSSSSWEGRQRSRVGSIEGAVNPSDTSTGSTRQRRSSVHLAGSRASGGSFGGAATGRSRTGLDQSPGGGSRERESRNSSFRAAALSPSSRWNSVSSASAGVVSRGVAGQTVDGEVSRPGSASPAVSSLIAPPTVSQRKDLPLTHCPYCQASLAGFEVEKGTGGDASCQEPVEAKTGVVEGSIKNDMSASDASRTRFFHHSSGVTGPVVGIYDHGTPLTIERSDNEPAALRLGSAAATKEADNTKSLTPRNEDDDSARVYTMPSYRPSSSILSSAITSARANASRPPSGPASMSAMRSTHNRKLNSTSISSKKGSSQSIRREVSSKESWQKAGPPTQQSLEAAEPTVRDYQKGDTDSNTSRTSSTVLWSNNTPQMAHSSKDVSVHAEHPTSLQTSHLRGSVFSTNEMLQILDREDSRVSLRAGSNLPSGCTGSSPLIHPLLSTDKVQSTSNLHNSVKGATAADVATHQWNSGASLTRRSSSSWSRTSRYLPQQTPKGAVAQLEDKVAGYVVEVETLSKEPQELHAFKSRMGSVRSHDDLVAPADVTLEVVGTKKSAPLTEDMWRSNGPGSRDDAKHSEIRSARSYSSILPPIASSLQPSVRSLTNSTTDVTVCKSQDMESVPASQSLIGALQKSSASPTKSTSPSLPKAVMSSCTVKTGSTDVVKGGHGRLPDSEVSVGEDGLRETRVKPPLSRSPKGKALSGRSTQRTMQKVTSRGASMQSINRSRPQPARPRQQLTLNPQGTISLSNSRIYQPLGGVAQSAQPHRGSRSNTLLSRSQGLSKTRVNPVSPSRHYYGLLDDSAALPSQALRRGTFPYPPTDMDSSNFSSVVVVGSRVVVPEAPRAYLPVVGERGGGGVDAAPCPMSDLHGPSHSLRPNLHTQRPRVPSGSFELSRRKTGSCSSIKPLVANPETPHAVHPPREGGTPESLVIHAMLQPHSVPSSLSVSPYLNSVPREDPHHPAQQPSPLTSLSGDHALRVDALGFSVSHLSNTPGRGAEEERNGIAGAGVSRSTPTFMFFPTYNYFTELQNQVKQNLLNTSDNLTLSSCGFDANQKGGPRRHLSSRKAIRRSWCSLYSQSTHLHAKNFELNSSTHQDYNINSPSAGPDRVDHPDFLARGCGIMTPPEFGKEAYLANTTGCIPAIKDFARLRRRVAHEGVKRRYQSKGALASLRKRARCLRKQWRGSIPRKLSSRYILDNTKPYCLLSQGQTTISLSVLRRMLLRHRSRASMSLSAKKKDKNT